MDISGKVIQVLPLQTGQGKNGEWRKQDFVIEVPGQYPKKVCIAVWGDKIDASSLKEGKDVTVSFDIESREFNGKWYTDVKAWKIESKGQKQEPGKTSKADDYDNYIPESKSTDMDEDLPF